MPSEERLHPLSIVFSFGKSLKAFAVPALLGLFVAARRPGPNVEAWMLLLLVPAAVAAVARYLSFRLRYEGAELVIRSGIVFRNERHIPYARIQNLDAVQNVFHRLLRVIEVRVETGGGAEPEATISVLPASALEEMRRRVFAREPSAPEAPAVPVRPLLEMPLRELLLHGFLENRGMVVIGALYGLLWELGILERVWSPMIDEDADGRGLLRQLVGTVATGRSVTAAQVAIGLAGLVGFLLVVRIASMCWAVVRLYGFRLGEVGEDLRVDYGLFTRVAATIPVRRIQAVTIKEGPLYRLAGRVSVRVETAGGRVGQEGAGSAREWLAPLIRREALAPLLAEILRDDGEHDLDAVRWQPPHPGAFRRAVKVRLAGALVATLPVVLVFGAPGLVAAAILVPWSVVAARRYVDRLGWSAADGVVRFKSGWVWRNVTLARVSRVQAVMLVESPFDRRTAMARVRVDTAGASERSHRIDIPYLPRDRAAELQLTLSAQAAESAFQW